MPWPTESYHAIHKLHEAPERNGVVLHDCINRGQQITHALDISQVSVVLIVCQQHVLHLFQMDICANFCEWGVGIWMWNILSLEERDVTVGAVNILLYMPDPKQWIKSAFRALGADES